MGHVNPTNLAGPTTLGEERERSTRSSGDVPETKSRWWVWFLAIIIVAGLGFWYFRYGRTSTAAQSGGQTAAGPGGGTSANPRGRRCVSTRWMCSRSSRRGSRASPDGLLILVR